MMLFQARSASRSLSRFLARTSTDAVEQRRWSWWTETLNGDDEWRRWMEMMDKVDKQKWCAEMMDRDEYRISITVSQRCFANAFRISSNKSVCNQKFIVHHMRWKAICRRRCDGRVIKRGLDHLTSERVERVTSSDLSELLTQKAFPNPMGVLLEFQWDTDEVFLE